MSTQVKSEINRRLKKCQQDLEHLGAKRQTPTEQYQYLTDISMNFQKIVTEALTTNYGRRDMFKDHSSLRLVTAAVNRSESMSTMLAEKGHTYRFEGQSKNGFKVIEDSSELIAEEAEATSSNPPDSDGTLSGFKPSDSVSVRLYPSHPDVEDLLPDTSKIAEPKRGEVFTWLTGIYRESRGFEIGTFNPSLLSTILKEQSQKWQDIALGYVADIIVLTHTFVNDLLSQVCPVRRVRDGIMSLLTEELAAKYKTSIKHVEFLLDINLNGTPSTLNHYFNDNLQKWYVLLSAS